MKTSKNMLKKVLLVFFFLLLVCSFGVLLYSFLGPNDSLSNEISPAEIIVKEEEKKIVEVEENESIKMAPDVDLEEERRRHQNSDIIGRLEIPDVFNILIVRGNDNQYYLDHSVDQKQDIRGSEFMDYRVGPNSKQINIYGHNSRDKSVNIPFLKLEKFLDEAFFQEHPYIIFQHDGGKDVYKILSIKEITSDREHMNLDKNGQAFVDHIHYFMERALYTRAVTYDENSHIIVLQTCSHHLEDAYYLITGVKIDY